MCRLQRAKQDRHQEQMPIVTNKWFI